MFYVSAATLQNARGPQVSSVGRYLWPGTRPGTGLWPPTGFAILA